MSSFESGYAANPGELLVYDFESPSSYFSKAAERFMLFLLLFMAVAGTFMPYQRSVLPGRLAWWTRLTPWNLYFEELLVYNPVFLVIAFLIILIGTTACYRTNRGLGFLMLLWMWGLYGALLGVITTRHLGNFWLADFRQTVLGSMIAPIAYILASKIRLSHVLEKFCKLGSLFGIYHGVIGALFFVGVIALESPLQVGWWGEYVFILIYLLLLSRAVIAGKTMLIPLTCVLFGIIVPFHKPTLATFFFANIFLFALAVIASRRWGSIVYLRVIRIGLIIGILAAIMLPWLFSLGGGAVHDWIALRFTKVTTSGAERDLTGHRFEFWSWGLEQWKTHPLFGTGFGKWIIAPLGGEGDITYVQIHNDLITSLYQTGVFALVLWGTVIAWIIRMFKFIQNCSDSENFWIYMGLFAWCLCMIMASTYARPLGAVNLQMLFYICAGFLTYAEAQNYVVSVYGTAYEQERNNEVQQKKC